MEVLDKYNWKNSEWFFTFSNLTIKSNTELLYDKLTFIFNISLTVLPSLDKSVIFIEHKFFNIIVKETEYHLHMNNTNLYTKSVDLILDTIYFYLKNS